MKATNPAPQTGKETSSTQAGTFYALGAYVFWGVAPIYFVWVNFAAPLEILSYRIICALPLLVLMVVAVKSWPQLKTIDHKVWLRLGIGSVLLSLNWLTFIYAIDNGRMVEASLGYYINPLFTILLGALILSEKMSNFQWYAAVFAGLGMLVELMSMGEVPLLAVTLALTFGLYGLVRKGVNLSAPLALGLETLLLVPFALGFVFVYGQSFQLEEIGMLSLGGVVTVIPLVCFGAAASRLPLSTLGFFQYIAPTLTLLLAVIVYLEEVSWQRWLNLALIWCGLFMLVFEQIRLRQKEKVYLGS